MIRRKTIAPPLLLFAFACTAPDVQVVPTVSVGKRLDEGVDTGAVYGSIGVSFVPAVPSTAYLPPPRWDTPPPWYAAPPISPAPDPAPAPTHTDEDHHPTHDHPEDPDPDPEETRTPWELILAAVSTLVLALLEGNRRTVRVGLKEKAPPAE